MNLMCGNCWSYNPRGTRYCGNCGRTFVDLMTRKLQFGFKSMIVMFGIMFVLMILFAVTMTLLSLVGYN